MPSLRPTRGERCGAIPAGDKSAQREILADVFARRRSGLAIETVLDFLKRLEADEGFMMSLAQTDAPLRRFDHASVDGARQKVGHGLVDGPRLSGRKSGYYR